MNFDAVILVTPSCPSFQVGITFHFSWVVRKSGIAGSDGNTILRSGHTVLHSISLILHSLPPTPRGDEGSDVSTSLNMALRCPLDVPLEMSRQCGVQGDPKVIRGEPVF